MHVADRLLDAIGRGPDGVCQVADVKNLVSFRGAIHRREINAIISGKTAYKESFYVSTAQITVQACFRYMVVFQKSGIAVSLPVKTLADDGFGKSDIQAGIEFRAAGALYHVVRP